MRLATLRNGRPDGELVVVVIWRAGPDPARAIEDWDQAIVRMLAAGGLLNNGGGGHLDPPACAMPRSWQWLDGSAFASHGDLMQIAFNRRNRDRPLMYQGMSDRFYARPRMCPSPAKPTASTLKANSASSSMPSRWASRQRKPPATSS
jgi:fumarylacetoacetate (FAA) hydrolase